MKKTYQDALAYYGITSAHPGGFSLTKRLLKKEKLTNSMKVLDAGCGIGMTSAYMAKRYGAQVTAIDVHAEMVEKAQQLMELQQVPVEVRLASVESLPFADESFDLVVVESVLTFTHTENSLLELQRVLKKGGVLLAVEMCGEGSLGSSARQKVQQLYGVPDVYTEGKWLELFHKAGFERPQVMLRRTVWEEMLNSEASEVASAPSVHVPPNAMYEQIILAHQKLLSAYGDRLGYRVFRAVK